MSKNKKKASSKKTSTEFSLWVAENRFSLVATFTLYPPFIMWLLPTLMNLYTKLPTEKYIILNYFTYAFSIGIIFGGLTYIFIETYLGRKKMKQLLNSLLFWVIAIVILVLSALFLNYNVQGLMTKSFLIEFLITVVFITVTAIPSFCFLSLLQRIGKFIIFEIQGLSNSKDKSDVIKSAIIGFFGTIIVALIALFGTILTILSGK